MKFIFLIIVLSGFTVFGCTEKPTSDDGNLLNQSKELQQQVDQKAPEFELKTLEGNIVKLSDYKGKVVLLDFWATWCGPCRKGIPDLIELQDQFEKDLVIIGISLDQANTINQLQPFINNYKIDYPVVLGDNKVVKDYGNITAIPTSFIINQNGEIVNKFIGLMPKSKLVEEINSLLKKS